MHVRDGHVIDPYGYLPTLLLDLRTTGLDMRGQDLEWRGHVVQAVWQGEYKELRIRRVFGTSWRHQQIAEMSSLSSLR